MQYIIAFFKIKKSSIKSVKPRQDKRAARNISCILQGYLGSNKPYKCYHETSNKVIENLDIKFDEDDKLDKNEQI